ncbi:MAG: hypothetical protein ACLU99_01735 [Alphaproteobacteria bacterium]
MFDDSIESEVPSEVPAEAGNAAPSTPDSVKAPEEKQTPAETVVEEDISVEDHYRGSSGRTNQHPSGFGRCIESTRKSRNPGPKKQRAEKHYGNRRPRFLSRCQNWKNRRLC